MSCLALKSFMFCSNLGLINTVSSVRSKPSFEVLKLASLRSSWGVLVKRRKFSKATLILRLTAMQATWGSLLGLLPEGGTCTVHGQRQKDKTSRSFVVKKLVFLNACFTPKPATQSSFKTLKSVRFRKLFRCHPCMHETWMAQKRSKIKLCFHTLYMFYHIDPRIKDD